MTSIRTRSVAVALRPSPRLRAGARLTPRGCHRPVRAGVPPAQQRAAVRAAGVVVRDLHVIRALACARLRGAAPAGRDARGPRRHAGRAMRAPRPRAPRATWDRELATAFVQSTRVDKVWTDPKVPATGDGVTVGVIDTGIAGGIADFAPRRDATSRVVASVVTNPDATTATDRYGHGTHVAGIIAGSTQGLSATDPLANRYDGTAPTAKLVSLKASDDHGNAYVSDVIAALQFVVDHGADYGIRVVNLSLRVDRSRFLSARSARRRGRGRVGPRRGRRRGCGQPWDGRRCRCVCARERSVRDHRRRGRRPRHQGHDRRHPRPMVEPRGHAGRVRQAGPRRARRSHRGTARTGQRLPALCSECVVDGRYFRLSGTSMAAPVVAGIAADLLSRHPDWTPDQVKGALTYNSPVLDRSGEPTGNLRPTADGAWEVAADSAIKAAKQELVANVGLTPSSFVDPTTGWIDETRASWRRASWRSAIDGLRASWGAASWSCECADDALQEDATTTRASWRRASWGRASWRSFFGNAPSDYGELGGGARGAKRGGGSSRTASG